VYDPFCGFGTTGFVANWLGHHFIGSDINITPCKENVKRWKE
jgi:DNA modification methylase